MPATIGAGLPAFTPRGGGNSGTGLGFALEGTGDRSLPGSTAGLGSGGPGGGAGGNGNGRKPEPAAGTGTGTGTQSGSGGRRATGGELPGGTRAPRGASPSAPDERPGLKATDRRRVLRQRPARYRSNPAPAYPEDARRLHQEGEVLLRVTIDPHGRVERVELERSSGHESLDQAALRAVRQWQFDPARLGDEAVTSTVNVPVRFHLR